MHGHALLIQVHNNVHWRKKTFATMRVLWYADCFSIYMVDLIVIEVTGYPLNNFVGRKFLNDCKVTLFTLKGYE